MHHTAIELPLQKWSMEEARDKAYDAAIGSQVEYIHQDDEAEWCTVTDMEIGEYSTLLVLQSQRGTIRWDVSNDSFIRVRKLD
ncbi:MAG: hypothetical protein IVW51_14270 [Thermaceae bacterium]|nr:hypothetical protein [Thermaceae bacterium]